MCAAGLSLQMIAGCVTVRRRAHTAFAPFLKTPGMKMTSRHIQQNAFATILIAVALSFCAIPACAADEAVNNGSHAVHPVDDSKKAAKAVGHGVRKTTRAIGHGFRDGARAVGHGARKVTRKVGHAFRDGAHKITNKKD